MVSKIALSKSTEATGDGEKIGALYATSIVEGIIPTLCNYFIITNFI